MQERHSLFSGAHSALPPGPGLITGKTRLGVLLLTSFLACGGIASLWVRSGQKARHTCSLAAGPGEAERSPAPQLGPEQRAQLEGERDRLLQILAGYEDSMEHGQGCRLGFVKYRLDYLRIEEKLARCGYQRAQLRRQIAHLEGLRARMLTGYGETQGPEGHDE
jgi:hypothetical protein